MAAPAGLLTGLRVLHCYALFLFDLIGLCHRAAGIFADAFHRYACGTLFHIVLVDQLKSGTTALKYGKDFELVYHNNIKKGTASVTAKGIGAYAGSEVTVNYHIR